MITIHKYPFQLGHEFEIEMPRGAKILDVQQQNDQYIMWAMVDTEHLMEKRKFKGYRTGEELNGLDLFRTHVATIQGIYVWHIFE